MTDTKENIMGTLPIGKLLMKMSVPVILSMLVSTLYGVIDSIFVSRLGDNALTAMSLATPISSLIACITVGFSVGIEVSQRLTKRESSKQSAFQISILQPMQISARMWRSFLRSIRSSCTRSSSRKTPLRQ